MPKMLAVATLLLGLLQISVASDLKAGDPAPDLKLQADDGTTFHLQSRRGRWTVLYFYPKADTPGCTQQACAFRDNILQLRRLGAEIYGISGDTVEALRKFRKNHRLNFPLLADPQLKAIKAYGTQMPSAPMSKRWTFIVGPDLKIRAIEKNVDPVLDAGRVAAALRRLQKNPPR